MNDLSRNLRHPHQSTAEEWGKYKAMVKDMDKEVWKDIPGYSGVYQASNKGRVRSLSRDGHERPEPIIMKLGKTNGYDTVRLIKDRKYKTKRVHRLVAKCFIPNPENKPFINHKNNIRDDNMVENLEWCTQSENMRHAIDNGYFEHAKGVDTSKSKLNPRKVKEIRKKYKEENTTYPKLGKKYGVSKTAIGHIIRGESWTHV